MEIKNFCHSCGIKLPGNSRFCPGCGVNLSSLANKPTTVEPPKSQFVPFVVAKDDDEDDSYIDRLQHAEIRQTELHVDIIKDRQLGESVGSLIAQALQSKTPLTPEPPRIAPPVTSKEAFLTEFQKEAGTMRREKN